MNFKISIIIPVYNAENTLNRCLDSIVNQEYKNYEVILINDGSTDNSKQILDEYKDKYTNIIVKHKINEGVSSARNRGLEIASGEYIMFADSDDFLSKDCLKTLINEINSKNIDLITSSFFEIYTEGNIVEHNILKNSYKGLKIINNLPDYYFIEGFIHPCWGKLYKREIIINNNIKFEKQSLSEDTVFNIEYLKYCKNIGFFNEKLYYYYCYTENNLTSKVYENVFEIYIEVENKFKEFGLSESTIEKTMYPQYYNSVIKVIKSNNFRYSKKKDILNKALNNSYIREKFTIYNENYKIRIINNLIKNRVYLALIILFKIIKV